MWTVKQTSFISLVPIGVVLILMASHGLTWQSGELFQQILSRRNHGATLHERRQVHLTVTQGRLVFYYRLPVKELNVSRVDVRCNKVQLIQNPGTPQSMCREMSMIKQMHDMRIQSLRYIQKMMRLITEVLAEIPAFGSGRQRRSWASGWAYFTGLAQQTYVDNIQEVLDTVQEGIQQAATAWTSGTSTFLAAIEIERKRVDAIEEVLEVTRDSFLQFHREFLDVYGQQNIRLEIIGHIMKATRNMIFELSQIDYLYNAVVSLKNGQLSHFILVHKELQASLDWFQFYLDTQKRGLVLLHEDSHYYYKSGLFKVFKYNQFLVLNLYLRLTIPALKHHLSEYAVTTVPLEFPDGDLRHYTELKLDFEAILYDPDVEYYVWWTYPTRQ